MQATERPVLHRDVVRFERTTRGAYEDVSYTPVFRSSALFFAWVDGRAGVDTVIAFMNYWRWKNGNRSVSCLLTLRSASGERLRRVFLPIEKEAYQFSVRQLLGPSEPSFIGSLEIELFSARDLKFPYPAVEVFYTSAAGATCVHAYERVFNNVEDQDHQAGMNPWQTGFDIAADDRYGSYIMVVNGPRAAADPLAELKIYDAEGRLLPATLPLGRLEPYAARMILLDEVPGLREFLGGRVGFCKINLDLVGIFLRLACGMMARDRSCVETTHSYYDCNEHVDYYRVSEIPPGEYACFFPFNLVEGLDLELVLYPIFAKSRLAVSLDAFSLDGRLRARLERIAHIDSHGGRMVRLDVRRLLAARGVAAEEALYCLHVEAESGNLPARVTLGMNYRGGEVGCNINLAMLTNAGYGVRKRLYLWGPILWTGGGRNWILISHLQKRQGLEERATARLTLFGDQGVIGRWSYETASGTALNVQVEMLIRASAYEPRPGQILWYTLESDCPNYLSRQIHVSPEGFVGGDPSF